MDKFILKDENKNLFLQLQPQFIEEEKLDLFYKRIEMLLKYMTNDIEDIKNNGFVGDFEDIDFKKWFTFISKSVVQIENIKKLTKGEEKLELLIAFISIIIINLVPIPKEIKILFINKLTEFIPGIVDSLIFVSKKMHTFSLNIFKKIKKCASNNCSCCF